MKDKFLKALEKQSQTLRTKPIEVPELDDIKIYCNTIHWCRNANIKRVQKRYY
jgi:hypothetical protein